MPTGTFATVINCIDGRAKRPVDNWVHLNLRLNFVDLISEPGPDGVMTHGTPAQLEEIKRKVLVSRNAHHSEVIILAGHHDCAGNPISEAEHRQQIVQGAQIITSWGLGMRVIGLWITSNWGVEQLSDTGMQGDIPESYALTLTCIDGRVTLPLTDWMKQHFGVHYIDIVTEPEPDSTLCSGPPAVLENIRRKLRYAIATHHPNILTIAAHHDCGGSPLAVTVHHDQLRHAVHLLATWELNVPIVGIWLDDQWQVNIIGEAAAHGVA